MYYAVADGLSSPESEEYPGMNGHCEGSRPSSNYTNRWDILRSIWCNKYLSV